MTLGEGSNESKVLVRDTSPFTERSMRAGKIAELGLIRLVHDCLAQLEEFASGKRFGEEVREVLVTFYVRYDKFKLVIFHDLTDKKMGRGCIS